MNSKIHEIPPEILRIIDSSRENIKQIIHSMSEEEFDLLLEDLSKGRYQTKDKDLIISMDLLALIGLDVVLESIKEGGVVGLVKCPNCGEDEFLAEIKEVGIGHQYKCEICDEEFLA